MFLEILQTLIKVLIVFFILIVAFGLAFYILLLRVWIYNYVIKCSHSIKKLYTYVITVFFFLYDFNDAVIRRALKIF